MEASAGAGQPNDGRQNACAWVPAVSSRLDVWLVPSSPSRGGHRVGSVSGFACGIALHRVCVR